MLLISLPFIGYPEKTRVPTGGFFYGHVLDSLDSSSISTSRNAILLLIMISYLCRYEVFAFINI